MPDNWLMSGPAHLIVPFASCNDPTARELARGLPLPNLERLLARLTATTHQGGDEWTLTPPHERVLAQACGIAAPDGCVPWAAWQRRQDGQDPGTAAWAWVTLCHWQVGNSQVALQHPQRLGLDAEESQALLETVAALAREDGLTLHYDGPTRWLACGELLRGLPTASLDRVIGRDLDPWMPDGDAARPLRRLLGEVQMLLHDHPVNEQRERGGQLPVNSVWISGSGALPANAPTAPAEGLRVPHHLRDAALLADWEAWAEGWRLIDAGECVQLLDRADRGDPVTLTLCGERASQRFELLPRSLFKQLAGRMARVRAWDVLEPL